MSDYYHGDRVMCIIEEFKLDFLLGQVCKYILLAGNKPENSELRDLQKAKWYLDRKIKALAPPDETVTANKEAVHVGRVTSIEFTVKGDGKSVEAVLTHGLEMTREELARGFPAVQIWSEADHYSIVTSISSKSKNSVTISHEPFNGEFKARVTRP